jgi:hypothetical protein
MVAGLLYRRSANLLTTLPRAAPAGAYPVLSSWRRTFLVTVSHLGEMSLPKLACPAKRFRVRGEQGASMLEARSNIENALAEFGRSPLGGVHLRPALSLCRHLPPSCIRRDQRDPGRETPIPSPSAASAIWTYTRWPLPLGTTHHPGFFPHARFRCILGAFRVNPFDDGAR